MNDLPKAYVIVEMNQARSHFHGRPNLLATCQQMLGDDDGAIVVLLNGKKFSVRPLVNGKEIRLND